MQTHTRWHTTPSSSYTRRKPCPPCIAAHAYVEPSLSLLHHPAMFSPLFDGYEHHIVHLRCFYSTAR